MPNAVARVEPLTEPPDADITVPGSKSHTNRALVCAALADGRSTLDGLLLADDTEAMLGAIAALGVDVDLDRTARSATIGGGLAAGRPSAAEPIAVDVRQSGTSGRFLLPVLAAVPGRFVLDGDDQLRARPFGPQLDALASLGAAIEGERLPFGIDGRRLTGAELTVPSSISSQFLSGLLLAAPLFAGTTTITVDGLVSRPYVELTRSTMAAFGVEVPVEAGTYRIDGGPYRPAAVRIEPDASAASYFFAAAAITGGRVRIDGLGTGTVQGDLRFVDVLERMGAAVTRTATWTEVRGTGALRGVSVDMSDISDTAQTLAVVASFADGPTEVTGIGFIRRKETDRIAAVATELNRRGVPVTETDDGWIVEPAEPQPGLVATYDDHRMAMSFALLGLRTPGIEIDDPGCVRKTFPDFFETLERLR